LLLGYPEKSKEVLSLGTFGLEKLKIGDRCQVCAQSFQSVIIGVGPVGGVSICCDGLKKIRKHSGISVDGKG